MSFHVQPKAAKDPPCYKKDLSVHFVVLCEALTKPSEFYEFPPPHSQKRALPVSLSFKFKGKM